MPGTKCRELQRVAENSELFRGNFKPQCDESGQFERIQCWDAVNQCWCVDSEGRELEGTRSSGASPDCSAGTLFLLLRFPATYLCVEQNKFFLSFIP